MNARKILSWIGIGVLALVLLIVGFSSFYVVQQNEYGVVLEFGAVKDIKTEPGLYFKAPFVQSVTTLPKTVLLYDLPISDVITADKHSMVLDSFTMWRISDPRLFIESLSGSLSNAESRINANVYNALKTVISSQNQEAIISGRDGLIVSLVMQNIGSSFDRYGIEILAVETKTLDLPDDNKDAVTPPRATRTPSRSATPPTVKWKSSSPKRRPRPRRSAPRATPNTCGSFPRSTIRTRKPTSIPL